MHSENDPKQFVATIELSLAGMGISVGSFCERAGINRATWQRWKAGKFIPHPSMLRGVQATFAAIMADAEKQGTAA